MKRLKVPLFRPVPSAIGIPTYKLAKFLVAILSDIAQNEFTIQDSFTFVEEILSQDSDPYMVSLDFDVLFTKISSDETSDICTKKLFQNLQTLVKRISKNNFSDLLNLSTKESLFIFNNNKFYI